MAGLSCMHGVIWFLTSTSYCIRTNILLCFLLEGEDANCQECGKCYDDEDEKLQKAWIGCDKCWRWFHYQCVGFKRKPSKKTNFICRICKIKAKSNDKM